jgi:hypothetical protein
MSNATRETIYALSSGRPPAAIAVVRISGPRAGAALKALTGRIPDARKAALARVRGRDGEIVDQALALWFPGSQSFSSMAVTPSSRRPLQHLLRSTVYDPRRRANSRAAPLKTASSI